jgi:hypothetical protein
LSEKRKQAKKEGKMTIEEDDADVVSVVLLFRTSSHLSISS